METLNNGKKQLNADGKVDLSGITVIIKSTGYWMHFSNFPVTILRSFYRVSNTGSKARFVRTMTAYKNIDCSFK